MNVAYCAQNTQEVEADERFAVVQFLDDPLEELGFGNSDGDGVREPTYLQEWFKEVLEGDRF